MIIMLQMPKVLMVNNGWKAQDAKFPNATPAKTSPVPLNTDARKALETNEVDAIAHQMLRDAIKHASRFAESRINMSNISNTFLSPS